MNAKNVIVNLTRAIAAIDPATRRRYRFGMVEVLLRRKIGWRLHNIYEIWYQDQEFLNKWKAFDTTRPFVHDRQYVLYSMAKSVSNLPGDTVECGTFEGASSYWICLAMQEKTQHTHHIFDSFEGLSQPDLLDKPSVDNIYKWKKHDLSVPLERVQKKLACFDFIQYYKGWIPDRFHEIEDRKFSLVHIDVDLYQPTYDSLAFFYERMIPGGLIICDDYGYASCPGAKRAFDEFMQDKPEQTVIHLTNAQGFIIKR